MTHSTNPKNKGRAARYEAWLRTVTKGDLERNYHAATVSHNAYQKRAIVDEMRRRERQSEGVA